MAMDLPDFLTAGHVEQLAKMSRLPKPSHDHQNRSIPSVKLRTVTYRPPEPAKETDGKQKHDISTDSNTDIDTPRPPTESNKPLFHKNSLPDDDLDMDSRSQLERLQNKLRQREKQRLLKEENFDSRKENRRRRVLTKRERDRMRRQGQMFSDDSHDDVMSEINFRHMRGYHSGRSGYSTPGGSVDEMKLGRNMRAAPRRMETKDGVRMSQKNNSSKDLIEILNRRQQLLQQQRETRKRFIAEQEAKEKAKQIVNLAYLGADTSMSRKGKEERKRESEKLLDDAFSLTRNMQTDRGERNAYPDTSHNVNDGMESPGGQGSAVNQLWSNGHIQDEGTREDNKGDDFFEQQGTSGMETEDHMIKYVRDELQRLET